MQCKTTWATVQTTKQASLFHNSRRSGAGKNACARAVTPEPPMSRLSAPGMRNKGRDRSPALTAGRSGRVGRQAADKSRSVAKVHTSERQTAREKAHRQAEHTGSALFRGAPRLTEERTKRQLQFQQAQDSPGFSFCPDDLGKSTPCEQRAFTPAAGLRRR